MLSTPRRTWWFQPIAICLAFIVLLMLDRRYREPEIGIAFSYPGPGSVTATRKSDNRTPVSSVEEVRYALPDGTKVYKFRNKDVELAPSLIILTLLTDSASYGKEGVTRTFQDYVEMLYATGLDMSQVSLGLAIESADELARVKSTMTDVMGSRGHFPRVTLLHVPPPDMQLDRNRRHQLDANSQDHRRYAIAQLRNALTFNALHSESHILWLDADVYYLSPNIVQTMLAHSHSEDDAALLTARCELKGTYDYDKNAWAGTRQPNDGDVHKHNVKALIKGARQNDLIPLNSIGGTILLIRASLVHHGLVFPAGKIVGMGWDQEGHDGVETEGLCLVAKYLLNKPHKDYCFVLGGNHHVKHTND